MKIVPILFLFPFVLVAQYEQTEFPYFNKSWLNECTDYFSPLWTDFVPDEGRCNARPRKTYDFKYTIDDFEYAVDVSDVVADSIRTILHFVKPHDAPHRTIFKGYLPLPIDTFRYSFSHLSDLHDHYFYFIADRPSLITVFPSVRNSTAGLQKPLRVKYKTQLYRNCNISKPLERLFSTTDTVCTTRNICEKVTASELVEVNLPILPERWVEDCPAHFENLFEKIFYDNQEQCQPLKTSRFSLSYDEDFVFSFPLDSTQTVHHFFRNYSDFQDLEHKRTRTYENEFIYELKTNADRNRDHFFYVVDSTPTLVVLSAAEVIASAAGDRINYSVTHYRDCQILEKQILLTNDLTGYCPYDANPCHPFKKPSIRKNRKNRKIETKTLYIKDRTCNTALGVDYLTVLIPKSVLPHCQKEGHRFITPLGELTLLYTQHMTNDIALAFKASPELLTTQNILNSKIIIAL